MIKPKILYGQKWVDDESFVLAGRKSRHEDQNLPTYEYIEYTQEVEQALEQQAQYDELVKAVGHAHQIQHEPPDVVKAMDALSDVFKAYKPFLPPPSIADRLDELSDTVLGTTSYTNIMNKIRALAEEVRELEK